jgi:hypothetical protein
MFNAPVQVQVEISDETIVKIGILICLIILFQLLVFYIKK